MNILYMNARLFFVLCLLIGLMQPLQAANRLFYAEVEITDESVPARQASIASAFKKVLVKLTGNSKIESHKGVPKLLKNSSDYVSEFRYRVADESEVAQQDDGALQVTKYIQIQFDKPSVERALAEAGIATWEGFRPAVMLWLAYKQDGKHKLLDGETLPEAVSVLQAAADDRGLPLQLPLMDLHDQAAMSGADIWSDKELVIRPASERYPHDVILTAKITGAEGAKWNGSWVLYNRDERSEFTRRGNDLSHALQRGMDRAADLLAQSYAPVISNEPDEVVSVRILQINSTNAYTRAIKLMEAQSGVSRVSVKRLQENELLLAVRVRGGMQTLSSNLALVGELSPVTEPVEGTEDPYQGLTFRLY